MHSEHPDDLAGERVPEADLDIRWTDEDDGIAMSDEADDIADDQFTDDGSTVEYDIDEES